MVFNQHIQNIPLTNRTMELYVGHSLLCTGQIPTGAPRVPPTCVAENILGIWSSRELTMAEDAEIVGTVMSTAAKDI